MVVGMDRFKDHFEGYEEFFVIIGGVACDEWFTQEGLKFRATKDVDMVLLLEASHVQFVSRFWAFIKDGNYSSQQKSQGKKVHYRFMNPQEEGFPVMLELFSRIPVDLILDEGQKIVPIPAGEDISSLSAILLDEDYYRLILDGRNVVRDLPVVQPHVLILLKAKAWLDLIDRKNQGENVNSSDIKKHRNDVFRLAHILPVDEIFSIPSSVLDDFHRFLDAFQGNSKVWGQVAASIKQSINRPMQMGELLETLEHYFQPSSPGLEDPQSHFP